MEVKNKELKKLYDSITLYFDSYCLPSLITAFMVCDDAIEGEITALKDELTDANRYKDIYRGSSVHLRTEVFERGDELRKANNQIESLKKMIDELKEKLNNEHKHGEDLADANCQLASENDDLKAKTGQLRILEHSRITWRARAQHAEKEVEDLNKNISNLEKRLAQASNSTELHLREENDRLREVVDDLEKAIEFQNEKIEELEAEKARLKEAYDIHETTIKRLKLLLGKEHIVNEDLKKEDSKPRMLKEDLSYGHEFEFGDKVYVPWSDGPYMYVKCGMMYNPRTERLVYVGKDQHLKWFGEKFEIK